MLNHDVVRSLVTQVTGYLQWLINTFTQLEIEMNSIERVKVKRKKTQRCVTFFRHIYSWWFFIRSHLLIICQDRLGTNARIGHRCVKKNCNKRGHSLLFCQHYSEIDLEAAYDAKDDANRQLITAPSGWPHKGSINFRDVCARYRKELPLVLEDVTFTVKQNEKVGVVGRTGSGKSTLMNLLFRIVELDSGSIGAE